MMNKKTRDPARLSSILLPRSRSAQMEMSVGTIVTIVLLMIVLVLGIFFIQKIFNVGTNAVDTIDNQVQSQLQKLFSGDDQLRTGFYPTSREVIVKKGDTPKGFAFQIRNSDPSAATFSFTTVASDVSKCNSITLDAANNLLLGGAGSIDIGSGDTSTARIVEFVIPSTFPACTLVYDLKITKDSTPYDDINFILTVK
jgi:hypothetical protein